MSKPVLIKTPADAIAAFGAERIAHACGVDKRTVQNKAGGQFPAYWYAGIKDLAEASGCTVSLSAFKFARERAA